MPWLIGYEFSHFNFFQNSVHNAIGPLTSPKLYAVYNARPKSKRI